MSVDLLSAQVDLLSHISSASEANLKLVCDAGALAALGVCRDAWTPAFEIQQLQTLIDSLNASSES